MRLDRRCLGTVAYIGGLPCVLEEFCWGWSALRAYTNEILTDDKTFIHYGRSKISTIHAARNKLVEEMKGNWLVMLDSDHSPDPDTVVRLVDRATNYNLDVVTGLYQYKKHPHSPVLFAWNKDNTKLENIGEWDKDGLIEIGSAGAGCLLVQRRVFERIVDELKQKPFDYIGPYSEDHSFFIRLKKLGIKAYADTRIECRHLRIQPVDMDLYDKSYFNLSDPESVNALV